MYGWLALLCISVGSIVQYVADLKGDEQADATLKAYYQRWATAGFAITIVGVLLGGLDQYQSGKVQELVQAEMRSLQEQNIGLSTKNLRLAEKNTSLVEAASQAQVEMNNVLTGGNSKFFMYLVDVNPTTGELSVNADAYGTYKLPSVQLRVYELTTANLYPYPESTLTLLGPIGPVFPRGGTKVVGLPKLKENSLMLAIEAYQGEMASDAVDDAATTTTFIGVERLANGDIAYETIVAEGESYIVEGCGGQGEFPKDSEVASWMRKVGYECGYYSSPDVSDE